MGVEAANYPLAEARLGPIVGFGAEGMASPPQVNPQTSTVLPNLGSRASLVSASTFCGSPPLSGLHSSIVAGICLTAALAVA